MTGPDLLGSRGFTLVELLFAVCIVGILVAVGIPMYEQYREKAETSRALVTLRHTRTALEAGIPYLAANEMIFDTSGSDGGPVVGDLARALPGLSISKDVMVRLSLMPCGGGGSDVDFMQMITVYACNPDTFVWFIRTCMGMEIQRYIPGSAPGAC